MKSCTLWALALVGASLPCLSAAAPPPPVPVPVPAEYRDYRTVDTAVKIKGPLATSTPARGQPGYLGVSLETKGGKTCIAAVEPDSPAARAGLTAGDVLVSAEGREVDDPAALGELVRGKGAGERLVLAVERNGKKVDVPVTLSATSRPLTPDRGAGRRRVVLGVSTERVVEGLKLSTVSSGMPAERAGLKVGDVLTALDGTSLAGKAELEGLAGKQPGDQVKLSVKRDGKPLDVVVTLASDPTRGRGRGRGRATGWDDRQPRNFLRPVYRLAVVAIEYPDVKHNAKIRKSDWEKALFSTGKYNTKSVTGQKVFGSMNDFYQEVSNGAFRVEGKMFDWVQVKRKRAEYASDSERSTLLREALDRLLAKNGKKALEGYDGIFFLYAGERLQGRRGGLYWPHRSRMSHQSKQWSYFICPEGGRTMASISVITHEFGHMLGLPDLYARPEVPGQEGVGVWCTMSVGHGRDGRPLHFSAWCKERLGWLKPAVIDPRERQKLILAPIKGSSRECFKVLIRSDGSEYLLLENRMKKGFDQQLPAEGLLIWRVVDGRPVLEESHGIAGPQGPNLFLGSIPYPSGSNNAFTPHTTPSSKSLKGGGLPVHITNIRRLPGGKIAFHIGYEYL